MVILLEGNEGGILYGKKTKHKILCMLCDPCVCEFLMIILNVFFILSHKFIPECLNTPTYTYAYANVNVCFQFSFFSDENF